MVNLFLLQYVVNIKNVKEVHHADFIQSVISYGDSSFLPSKSASDDMRSIHMKESERRHLLIEGFSSLLLLHLRN